MLRNCELIATAPKIPRYETLKPQDNGENF